MKVAVVAEFYPRAHDPVFGTWAHRQAVAAAEAGVDVEVIVLHRPIPPVSALRAGPRSALREWRKLMAQPRHAVLDGIPVTYVRFFAPPRPGSYGVWGRWAARPLRRALTQLRRRFEFDLIHAHNAVPVADALRRGRDFGVPVITSIHGGDVYYTAATSPEWKANVSAGLDASALVVANSSGIAAQCRKLTTTPVTRLALGADLPERVAAPGPVPTLVTVAHLISRKRHADVLRAMWVLRDRWPQLRYVVVGDGPERRPLEQLAAELGVEGRVEFRGQLPPHEAVAAMSGAWLAVMASTEEAYGVAYVEAMAQGVPVIGAIREPGPLDLADQGSGIQLVAPGDVERLAAKIDRLLADRDERRRLSHLGRVFVADNCAWPVIGSKTAGLYADVLKAR